MRTPLAEQLLARTLAWTPDEVRNELPLLQAFSKFKYDEYQQFSPGMRFIESLVRWLGQFNDLDEKRTAFEFIKFHLIFISSEQILHLVSLAYTMKVEPLLIEKTSVEIGVDRYLVREITSSESYRINKRRILFLGLSDGSKIDYFRRCSNINNEQVSSTYHISPSKAKEMIGELSKDIGMEKFNTVFLIDDFTASGKSYFRNENEEAKGKIFKILNSLFVVDNQHDKDNSLYSLVEKSDLSIKILFYIATMDAVEHIRYSLEDWKSKVNCQVSISVDAIQLIEPETKNQILTNSLFVGILERYFDSSIVDQHYSKGKHDRPYLGFDECTLPFVLHHNTPNNSLPILWLQEDKDFIGLFPRVTRHKE